MFKDLKERLVLMDCMGMSAKKKREALNMI